MVDSVDLNLDRFVFQVNLAQQSPENPNWFQVMICDYLLFGFDRLLILRCELICFCGLTGYGGCGEAVFVAV